MNKIYLRYLFICSSIFIFSSCTTLGNLKFWGDEEEIIELPAELISIENKLQIKTLWKKNMGSKPGYGTHKPVLTSDTIYYATSEGTIYALSLKGKEIWSKKTEDYISGALAVGFKVLLYGTLDGELVALDENKGSELWRKQLSSEILSLPVTDGSIAVVQTADGKVTALDLKNGEEEWVYLSKVPKLSLRGTSSPILSNGAVFASFANGKSAMISSSSGSVRWELPITLNEGKSELERIVDIDGKAIVDGRVFVAATYQGHITAIDLTSGRALWQEKFSTTKDLVKSRSRIIGINQKDIVEGFGLSTGVTLWRQEGLKLRQLTSPVNIKGRIVVGDFEGYLHVIDSKDGKFIARSKISNKAINEIVSFSDELLVSDSSGRLISLSIK
jgi:outer membrane protein assembly factor BamB